MKFAECEEIHDMFVKATTRDELEKYKARRQAHSSYIRERLENVKRREHLARSNPENHIMLYVDKADSATTICPQLWRKQLRGEMDSNTYLSLGVMSVLAVGATDRLRYYVASPEVFTY